MIVDWSDLLFLGYFVALNSTYTALMLISVIELTRRRATRLPELEAQLLESSSTPPVTILVPAFDEERSIRGSVQSFLQLEYPALTVVVVNDGSADNTLGVLGDRFDLVRTDLVFQRLLETRPIRGVYRSKRDPRLWVVDKENGGKADALNVGINVSRTPLVCCVDADTLCEPTALLRLVEPFLCDPRGVVAASGTVRIVNGCTVRDGRVSDVGLPGSWLARLQIVEYLRTFLYGRMAFNPLGGTLIISGALGLFRKDALVAVGGYATDTVGEDMEVVLRLHRFAREQRPPQHLVHVPDALCFTEVPESVATLGRQRDRWHRGLADSLARHKDMLLNPRYGLVGLLGFPIFVAFELLGSVVELSGYVWFAGLMWTGRLPVVPALLLLAAAVLWSVLLSLASLLIDNWSANVMRRTGDRARLVLYALLESFGYRQLTLFFRLRGLVGFLLGAKAWGRMDRRGFDSLPLPLPVPVTLVVPVVETPPPAACETVSTK